MPVAEKTRFEAPPVPPGLAQDILERTGVAVAFFRPDGTAVADPAAAPAPADAVARLVREAAEKNQDGLQVGPEGLRAAWPIRVRSRPVLVAVGELAVSGEAEIRMGRRLLAAAAEAVRARVEAFVAVADRGSMAEALSQSYEEITLLHNLGEVLRVNRPAAELLKEVCEELRETTGAEAAAACLPAMDDQPAQTVVVGRLPLDVSDLPVLVGRILDSLGPDQCVVINNYVQEDPALATFSRALGRLVLVPLPLGDKRRGALAAFNRPGEEFGSPDAKLIHSSAASSAVFIENHRLYSELQQLMLDLVRALVSSVDAKDPYTCGHSSRVAITAREIARHLRLGDEKAEEVYLAGLLHDIGKIGTPEAILRKEGLLLPEEREIISRHPEVGGRIVAGIRKLAPVRDAILHHHERLDGKGYPAGLRGDEVSLMARIVGLADAFDAMTSNRPYRPMLPLEHVKREIERNIGTQFDPQVAQAFFTIDLVNLMQQFADQPQAVAAPGI